VSTAPRLHCISLTKLHLSYQTTSLLPNFTPNSYQTALLPNCTCTKLHLNYALYIVRLLQLLFERDLWNDAHVTPLDHATNPGRVCHKDLENQGFQVTWKPGSCLSPQTSLSSKTWLLPLTSETWLDYPLTYLQNKTCLLLPHNQNLHKSI
jgi:hypothetical protein